MKRRHVQWIATAAWLAGAGALLLAERRAPLRPVVQPKARRDLRNGLFALLSGLTITLLQDPLVGPLSRRAEARRWDCWAVSRFPAGCTPPPPSS